MHWENSLLCHETREVKKKKKMMAESVFEMGALGLQPKPKQTALKDVPIIKKQNLLQTNLETGDLVELVFLECSICLHFKRDLLTLLFITGFLSYMVCFFVRTGSLCKYLIKTSLSLRQKVIRCFLPRFFTIPH